MEMKRFWIFITLAILTATQCSHPYEEGMLGAFPYLEMMSGTSASFKADGSVPQKGEIKLSTNMKITTQVDYTGNDRGWISNISTSTNGSGITTISYTVLANTRRTARKAAIKILADNAQTGFSVTVNQEAYVMTGEAEVYEGDLILRSQDEVNNCIYTEITGSLTISGDDIHDLSALEHITAVGGSLIIEGCSQLSSFGPLNDLSVNMLCLKGAWTEALLQNYSGEFKSLEIENCLDHAIDISILTRFSWIENLRITGSDIINLVFVTEFTDIKSVTLLSCQVTQPEINYLKMMMPDTEFSIDFDYQTSFNLSATAIDEYYAEFRVSVLFEQEPDFIELGYVLSDDGTFDMSESKALNGWYFGTFMMTVNNLDPGQDYSIWIYGISRDNSCFLSEVETFTTTKVNFYTYTITPVYPQFTGSDMESEFKWIDANIIKRAETDPTVAILEFRAADNGTYEATVPEGYYPIYIRAYEENSNGFTWAQWPDRFELQSVSSDGSAGDITATITSNTFYSDYSESPLFRRPLANISVKVDFTGSVGDLSDITEIEVSLDGFYEYWSLLSDASEVYYGEKAYSFSNSVEGISGIADIAADRFIFPHNEDSASRTATVTITFASGETAASTAVLSETIEANNIYDITLNVKLNRLNGTFDVDQVEIVDGGIIEF